MIFYLDLLNESTGETHTIPIESLDTNLGRGWADLLKEAIDLGLKCCEPERIYSLNDKWANANIVATMQKYIDIIPDDIVFNGVLNQESMNYLHKFFEDYMRLDKRKEVFNSYPEDIKYAIREMNILIHRWEALRYTPKKINYSFDDRPTRKMTLSERNEFSWDAEAGDVILKYCHHGKKIEDIYKDNENEWRHVGDKNIISQFNMSSDFKVYLNQPGFNKEKDKFKMWLKDNTQFDIKDTGQGRVGKVIGDPATIADNIFGVTRILNVRYH